MNGEMAQALLAALYSARFFRLRPVLDDALRARLCAGQATGRLPAVLLWGVNGKDGTDERDVRMMDHVAGLLARIDRTLACRSSLTLVLCDSHGTLNRAAPTAAARYAAGVTAQAGARGWQVIPMSTLWDDGGITMARVDSVAAGLDVAALAPRLLRFAARHYRGGDPQMGAQRYLAARLLEKPVVARRFGAAIHLTPTEPALGLVQPELPTFHIWTERKGCSAKPWFVAEGG